MRRKCIPAQGRASGGGKKFPPHYRQLPPLAKLVWLKSDEPSLLIGQGLLQANQIQSEIDRLARQCRRIEAIVPSPCWLEEYQRGVNGRPVPFPPHADTTPMRCASLVLHVNEIKVLWPADYLTIEGVPYDLVADWIDRTERQFDIAPSHRPASYALKRMAAAGITLVETPLEPEDEAHLKAEIQNHEKQQNAV